MESRSAAAVNPLRVPLPSRKHGPRVPASPFWNRRDCAASARRMDRHRPYLQVQKHGRQLQFWLGDGRIGASLASGHGFSSPSDLRPGHRVGASALPYLTAGVFLVFGIYSKAFGIRAADPEQRFLGADLPPIFLIARRLFSEKVAVGSAWAWALLPNIIFWCTRAIWETSLARCYSLPSSGWL